MNAAEIAAAYWFALVGGFLVAMHLAEMRDRGDLNLFWKVNGAPFVLAGWLLDVGFNFTAGVLMFADPTWADITFSSRVEREANGVPGWRRALARWWARQLNRVRKGHIHVR